jgi:uncharacterized protein (DUF2235 family)
MPKIILFCADGTWNGPGQDDGSDRNTAWTNVFKLFNNLDGKNTVADSRLADEQERELRDASGDVTQIAKYLHGVGDSDNFLVKILGGTVGAGIITRIVRGYTFVSRNHQPGDKIILLGFSRGAYTARALAGMIAAQGLLAGSDNTEAGRQTAYRQGAAVWYAYRRQALAKDRSLFDEFVDIVIDFPAFLSQPPPATMVRDVPIEAVAVWDTVGALGIPVYVQKDVRADLFRFADTKLSDKVRLGFHAIAADEQRDDFEPTFWDRDDARVVQCLFPGAHADVGGGYPVAGGESQLSDGALRWMTDQLTGLRVAFAANPVYETNPDAAGVAHRPWDQLPFSRLPQSARKFPRALGLRVSTSLLNRLRAGPVKPAPDRPPAGYRPENLADYLDGVNPAPEVLIS